MRESTNESVSNARGSARLEEVAQRRKAVAARTTETQLDERPPLHPVRSSASPYNADMPFMEAPANTTRTEDGERGTLTNHVLRGHAVTGGRQLAPGLRKGLEYGESYAPVMKEDSLHLVTTWGGLKCCQRDATNAYIYTRADREICIVPPDGFEGDHGES
ncbi:hypothetical protein H257_11099 [Aphanomyces astaci]|uniref:Uncharacterized protein n=1 Tax=Aphanomyces astaci TaxID=112090 RepID=W4G537_APHAT|nr:hypothetical protein H257_11099 [Aphanomyces astaci]ETV74134.1 hypothetical protein H257_11099 [Aphanomyces astaci]|eukprot:XP_009836240.1 hypothetical protein H257_11099 [Aphanomyces astaci]